MSFKKKLFIGLSSLGITVAMSVFVLNSNKETIATLAYSNTTPEIYYSGISESSSGTTLLSSLQSLNTSKRRSLVGYDNMPSKFQLTDPGTSSGQVTSFYSGKSAKYSGNMNREHTWPASRTVGGRGSDPLEDDIHMTRPTLTSDNSSRGNSLFTYSNERGWDPASLGVESYRGDSARIIFYCVVADSRLGLVDRDIDSSSNHTMGKLSTLLEWNLKYPVLNREKTRNTEAEKLQGNRNPFIDHPEYACKIWGNENDNTRKACGLSPTPTPTPSDTITDIVLNYTEATLDIGDSLQLTVSPNPSSATLPELYWGSSNENVACVSDKGLVSAYSGGNATITVITSDGRHVATCEITVRGGAASSGSGCGGNIVTTSVLLSTISLLGAGLIIISRNKRKKNEE